MATFRKRSGSWQALVFDTKAAAEAWAKVTEAELVRGVFVSRKEAENTTLSEALDRYEREVSSTKKGHRREKTRISIWKITLWQNGF
ncbi:MAG: hypothetical protein M0T83_00455 [Nitrospiraceae bacterium]|jgi:ribosomal protein L21|nr:hypothetical protein [Nitrospiraceae bacterium]